MISNLKNFANTTYTLSKVHLSNLPTPIRSKILSKPKIRDRYDTNVKSAVSLFLDEVEENLDDNNRPTIEQTLEMFEERKREMKSFERRSKLKTIENKYFKDYKKLIEKRNNLLTWEMKEHLINLHSLDPDSWTYETLSQAFPVTNQEIKNLLSRKFKPLTGEKLRQHDLRVLENWKNLTNGKIGNIALLRKIINNRISERSNETLPSVPNGSTIKLQDLVFTPTGDMHEELDESQLTTRNQNRNKYSFHSIIEKYEKRLESLTKENENNVIKCHDKNVFNEPNGSTNQFDEITIQRGNKLEPQSTKKSRKMTLEQFKKFKSQSSSKDRN